MEGIPVMQRCCACGGGSVESWWELVSYERVTPIGVFVNPTLIVEKKRKSDIEKEVELLGLKVVDVLCKNRFRLG